MNENLAARLARKGWGKEDIEKTLMILDREKHSLSTETKRLQERVYWIFIIVICIINFGIAASLLPIMLALNLSFFYVLLAIIGLIVGFSLELVVRSMSHLEDNHHVSFVALIPFIAGLSILVMGNVSNSIQKEISIGFSHNFYLAAVIYGIASVIPFFMQKFIIKRNY